jgi:hypothetical protein
MCIDAEGGYIYVKFVLFIVLTFLQIVAWRQLFNDPVLE